MKRLPWWGFGLIGGIVLSLAGAKKLISFLRGEPGEASAVTAAELADFAAFLFLSGFTCGLSLWFVQRLMPGPRWFCDGLSGVVVLEVLFVCCAAMFEPSWLTTNRAQGAPMFIAAAVLGGFLGPWIGRDLRRELQE